MNDPQTVQQWQALDGDALVEALLRATWFPWEDDTIGGWCVMPYNGPPSTGAPTCAAFLGEKLARHIAHLHNQALPTTSGGTPVTSTTTATETTYDSRVDTLMHSRRVGELVITLVSEMLVRATQHDLSKTQPPEVEFFDRLTPRLRTLKYGDDDGVSNEYRASLAELGPALEHHYAHNRHHPEHWGQAGVAGMTLVDLVEMLCDWKASTERMAPGTGDLARSIEIAKKRFGLSDQLAQILANTAVEFDWITPAGEGTTS
jgi:hypothetical protein